MQNFFSSISKKIGTSLNTVADILFPYICFGCGASGTWLCTHCEHRIPSLIIQHCFLCQKNPTRYGEACFECQKISSPLDAVFSATCYQVPVIKRMIHAYKYHFVSSLAHPLSSLFAQAVEKSNLPLPSVIVPVPLHSKRLRYRGFNQSRLLANTLAQNVAALSNTPVQDMLTRVRFTKPQQKTASKTERSENLQNAFQVTQGVDLSDQVIWLVDDVATTHSTVNVCARALKNAGAKKVYAVVLAQD